MDDAELDRLVAEAGASAEEVREATRRRNVAIRRAAGSGVPVRRVAEATKMSAPQVRTIVAGRTKY